MGDMKALLAIIVAVTAADTMCYICNYDATHDAVGTNKPQCANGGDFNGIATRKCTGSKSGCGVITVQGEDIYGERVDEVQRGCWDASYPGEGCLTVKSDASDTNVNGEICYSRCTEDYCNSSLTISISSFILFVTYFVM